MPYCVLLSSIQAGNTPAMQPVYMRLPQMCKQHTQLLPPQPMLFSGIFATSLQSTMQRCGQ
jgi:hypothetical protein